MPGKASEVRVLDAVAQLLAVVEVLLGKDPPRGADLELPHHRQDVRPGRLVALVLSELICVLHLSTRARIVVAPELQVEEDGQGAVGDRGRNSVALELDGSAASFDVGAETGIERGADQG